MQQDGLSRCKQDWPKSHSSQVLPLGYTVNGQPTDKHTGCTLNRQTESTTTAESEKRMHTCCHDSRLTSRCKELHDKLPVLFILVCIFGLGLCSLGLLPSHCLQDSNALCCVGSTGECLSSHRTQRQTCILLSAWHLRLLVCDTANGQVVSSRQCIYTSQMRALCPSSWTSELTLPPERVTWVLHLSPVHVLNIVSQ